MITRDIPQISKMPEGTLVAAVMRDITQRIASRTLRPGDKLPSIRACAANLSVSKTTATDAYDRLVAVGSIESRPRSGFYVASKTTAPLSLVELAPRLDRQIDPLWVSRQALEATGTQLKPGCGWLPASWMPTDNVRRALRTLARGSAEALVDYASPLGLPALRELLARRLSERGIHAAPEQILLTESGTHAIDLLCRLLLEPGDTVLVDDPCYFNFLALLRAHRVKVIGVPMTADGPDLAIFAEATTTHRPKLYITNATLHNPTGATLTPVIAHRLLRLAYSAGLTIIEDDIFADFDTGPVSRLAAFDGLEQVIHIGSFSKTLSASVRCGFIAIPSRWVDDLLNLRVATSFSANRSSAELVLHMLKDGSYRKHMETLRQRLAVAMEEMLARLRTVGIEPWITPHAGMLAWCRLPEGQDASDWAKAALRKNIVLAPGSVFSPTQRWTNFMRFNAAQMGQPAFELLGAFSKNPPGNDGPSHN